MARWLALFGVAVVLAGAPLAAPPASADSEARLSGTVTEVGQQRLVLEEMVAWSGPGSGIQRRTLTVTPETSVVLVTRTDRWDDTSTPGWDSRAITLSELKPGDFVTVATRPPQANVAVSLQVVRPETGAR